MSSGLVPVTNAVAAIPEFVDDSCGILAAADDAGGLAAGIEMLYENPLLFEEMSKRAAERVRRQSDSQLIVSRELNLFFSAQKIH
jgi:glycosyltransferase involved in cell wall biosynthesis